MKSERPALSFSTSSKQASIGRVEWVKGWNNRELRLVQIATLEEMGLVQRQPDPTDGRQVKIELTTKGIAARNSAKDAKRTWLAQAMAQLNDDERETLFKAGEIIKRLADS